MTNKPSLSFVVPVFNKSAFLAETLNSLLNQTLKNIEIVVVDDCSYDSIEPLKKYYTNKDERISWYRLENNSGVGVARNFGNEKAKADIIAVNDADDMSFPNRAKVVTEYFKKNKTVSIVHSGFVVVDQVNEAKCDYNAQDFDIENVKNTGFCFICHSTMAYRKKVTEDIKYDTGQIAKLGMDDWKFQIDSYKKGYKIKGIDKQLSLYREMRGGLSSRNNEEAKEAKSKYIESIGGL